MHEYDERALDPPPINEYTHFVRTTLQVKRKLFKVWMYDRPFRLAPAD